MRCLFCKGKLEDKNTVFTIELGDCIIIVKNVPSHVCSQCGEASYGDDVYKELENVVDELRDSITEIAIADYNKRLSPRRARAVKKPVSV